MLLYKSATKVWLYLFADAVSGFLNKDHPKEVGAGNWSKWEHYLSQCSLGIAVESRWKNESQQITSEYMRQALNDWKQIGGVKTKRAMMNLQSDMPDVKATSLVSVESGQ